MGPVRPVGGGDRTGERRPLKTTVPPGLASQVTIQVDRQRTIGFMGKRARVHALQGRVRDNIEPICRRYRFVVDPKTTATRLAARARMAGLV